jgi:hypothetical protein
MPSAVRTAGRHDFVDLLGGEETTLSPPHGLSPATATQGTGSLKSVAFFFSDVVVLLQIR